MRRRASAASATPHRAAWRRARCCSIGARHWEVLAAPGHDPESVILFDAAHGVLISADALWENGFGVVFPELDGDAAFDDVGRVLDLIEALPVRCVIPGHGAPFTDVAARAAAVPARGWPAFAPAPNGTCATAPRCCSSTT